MLQSNEEPSQIHFRSLHYIQSRLPFFFGDEKFVIVDPYFPNAIKELLLYDKLEPLHIVMSGGFLATFLMLPQWPSNNYKIWVLCRSAKEILIQLCGLPADRVGVIPRYILFPLAKNRRDLDLNMPLQLVYGGRLSRNKGLLNLLSLTHDLQNQWGLPVELYLFGEFSDILSLGVSKSLMSSSALKEFVKALIQRQAWITPPEIRTSLSGKEWLSQAPENSVFINLSQLSHEDFGVSLAQAQSAGWPAILSSWGAHWDAQGDNAFVLPHFDLQWGQMPHRAQQKKMAQAVLDGITNQAKLPFSQLPSPSPKTIIPFEIRQSVAIAEKKYPGITDAARWGLKNLQRTQVGKRLFQDYNRIFSSPPSPAASSLQKPHKQL